ncbi:16S rRNA (cytidine(1402)-2'-O)-methyltransferase, partial [Agromyces humi]|uniref:16S rRNA (cytidine(1402)-2'-O)-methyltransferase n=1 Tax=Agromyces humi TaxID=1766800 RepID=UPI001F172673
SAVVTALAVSGLPTDRFAFEGFLPRKAGDRSRRLAELARDRRTLVFFEGPSRLAASLDALAEAFGADRPAAVCRELTKLHEEVRRGGLGELAEWAAQGVRGEICIVVGGAPEQLADAATSLDRVLELAASGTRLKDAVALVAAESGLGKRDLYEAALAARSSR